MKEHKLKTVSPYFEELWGRNKRFECRLNDRDFKSGDVVHLMEYDTASCTHSGRVVSATISYLLSEFDGLKEGYVVFGLKYMVNQLGTDRVPGISKILR